MMTCTYTDIIVMINSIIDIDKIIHQAFISECESFSFKKYQDIIVNLNNIYIYIIGLMISN